MKIIVKRYEDELTPSQIRERWVRALRKAGGAILNVYLRSDVNDVLNAYLRARPNLTKTDVISALIIKYLPKEPVLKALPERRAKARGPAEDALTRRKRGKRGGRRRVLTPPASTR